MGMWFAWLRNGHGVAGLAGGAALWMLSTGALALSMRANLAAGLQAQTHVSGATETLVRHLRGTAVLWSLGFTVLQVTSLLAWAFVLRACYRLRTAICFSVGAGMVMTGDLLGLLGLLVWVGTTLGSG